MKMLLVLGLLIITGCATTKHQQDHPLTYDGRWAKHNELVQEACVLRIIEIAPPTATKEDLDYNYKRCLLNNGAFF